MNKLTSWFLKCQFKSDTWYLIRNTPVDNSLQCSLFESASLFSTFASKSKVSKGLSDWEVREQWSLSLFTKKMDTLVSFNIVTECFWCEIQLHIWKNRHRENLHFRWTCRLPPLFFYTKVTNMCLDMGSCRILQILNLAKCRSSKRKFFVFFKGKHSFNPFKSTLEFIKKV